MLRHAGLILGVVMALLLIAMLAISGVLCDGPGQEVGICWDIGVGPVLVEPAIMTGTEYAELTPSNEGAPYLSGVPPQALWYGHEPTAISYRGHLPGGMEAVLKRMANTGPEHYPANREARSGRYTGDTV